VNYTPSRSKLLPTGSVSVMPSVCVDASKYYCWSNISQWAGYLSRYSDWLRAGRSGDRIPDRARFSAPVQTGTGDHPAPCTMGTGSFPGVASGRDVTLTPHPLLAPRSENQNRAIPLLSLRAFVACKKGEIK
jgi:hypothetical protein